MPVKPGDKKYIKKIYGKDKKDATKYLL